MTFRVCRLLCLFDIVLLYIHHVYTRRQLATVAEFRFRDLRVLDERSVRRGRHLEPFRPSVVVGASDQILPARVVVRRMFGCFSRSRRTRRLNTSRARGGMIPSGSRSRVRRFVTPTRKHPIIKELYRTLSRSDLPTTNAVTFTVTNQILRRRGSEPECSPFWVLTR